MSEQVVIAIIGAIGTVIVAVLSAIVAMQNNRLNAQKVRIDQHTDEQNKASAAIAKLDQEARDRVAQRATEREEDRKDQQQLIESLKEGLEFYKARWQEEAKTGNEQRIEIKGLTQQVIASLDRTAELNRSYAESDRAHTEDINRLKKKTEDYDKLTGQLETVTKMLNDAQRVIERMREKFDKDLATVNEKNDLIIKGLRERIATLEGEKNALVKEVAELRAKVKTLTDNPEPPQPGAKAPIPFKEGDTPALPNDMGAAA